MDSEKDLGVTIHEKLKFTEHINNKVNKANSMMGVIRHSFRHLDCQMFSKLYVSLVRPHVEYAVVSLESIPEKYICFNLESFQRRATKQINGLSELCYA